LRILLCSNYYSDHIGGIQMVAGDLCTRYRAHGHEVCWMAADVAPAPRRSRPADLPLPAWNFTEERLGLPYPLPSPAALRRVWPRVAWADVVHLHDCLYASNLVAYACARRLGKPVLLTQHIAPIAYRSPLLRLVQGAAYATAGRALLTGADQVVFVSDRVCRCFAGRQGFKRDPLVIENGLDLDTFGLATSAERRGARSALGLPAHARVLLFVGRFVEKKGLPLLRQAIACTPDLLWVLAGPPGGERPDLWKLPNLRVAGAVPRERLPAYYAAADALVLPSTGEGLPVVVQEAMGRGTPAVLSAETADALPDADGLVFPAEPAATSVVAAVRHALDAAGRRGFRERVSTFARERWDPERQAGRYEALLAELTSVTGSLTAPTLR
jgi:phosphatidylinositol alpha-1,6-mannosyltransferase